MEGQKRRKRGERLGNWNERFEIFSNYQGDTHTHTHTHTKEKSHQGDCTVLSVLCSSVNMNKKPVKLLIQGEWPLISSLLTWIIISDSTEYGAKLEKKIQTHLNTHKYQCMGCLLLDQQVLTQQARKQCNLACNCKHWCHKLQHAVTSYTKYT